jgi:hypothetical protein
MARLTASRSMLLALSIPTLSISITRADAACPPYRSDPAFLEDLQKDDFFDRVFPRATTPSALDQIQKFRVLAQQRSPDQVGDLAQLEGFWRLVLSKPLPFPITVPVPFTIEIRASRYPVSVEDLVRLEFDADGDGKPERVLEGKTLREGSSYTYEKEGVYKNTLRVFDKQGQVYSYETRLRVLSQAALDAELQMVWDDFKESLRHDNIAAALECIHTQSRVRYKESLEGISDLGNKAGEILGSIQFVESQGGIATYQMLRAEEAGTFSYPIEFAADYDAVWRIRSF